MLTYNKEKISKYNNCVYAIGEYKAKPVDVKATYSLKTNRQINRFFMLI